MEKINDYIKELGEENYLHSIIDVYTLYIL